MLKDSFKDIIEFGRLQETFEVLGKKVVMRSLTMKELRAITEVTSRFQGTMSQIQNVKIGCLARSIVTIDGMEFKGSIEERGKFWEDVQVPTLNKFYEYYEKLRKKQEKLVEEATKAKNLPSSSRIEKETG